MYRSTFVLFFVAVTSAAQQNGTDDALACGVGQPLHLNGSHGVITSPGYPDGRYPPNVWCSWTIVAPEGLVVKLDFDDFELQPSIPDCVDVLAVLTGTEPVGDEVDFSRIQATFCGRFPPPDFLSRGREVLLLFITDFNMQFRGFKIRYSFSKPKEECTALECRNAKCVPLDSMCDKKDDCGDGTDEENCGYPLRPIRDCGNPIIKPNLDGLPKNRIVGGSAAVPGSWPWQVQMRLRRNEPWGHACGATLINDQFIVTAAHCFKSSGDSNTWTVHFGKYERDNEDQEEEIMRYMAEIHIHPLFEGPVNGSAGNSTNKAHDVAVVRLNAPVDYSDWISPICLPSKAGSHRRRLGTQNKDCYVTGWGDTIGTGHWDVLKQAKVPLISNKICKEWYKNKYDITNTMICAGYKEGGTDACKGDSGGPLVTQYKKRWYLVGVVSFGDQCALPKKPGVYAEVSKYEKWITKTIKKSMKKTQVKKRWRQYGRTYLQI